MRLDRPTWLSSPVLIAVASAAFGLLGTGVGAILQGYWNTKLEHQKFEATLIIDALRPEDQNQRAKRLLFLVESGLVDGLNRNGIERLAAKPEELPQWGAADAAANAAFSDLGSVLMQNSLTFDTPLLRVPPEARSRVFTALEQMIGRKLPPGYMEENASLTFNEIMALEGERARNDANRSP